MIKEQSVWRYLGEQDEQKVIFLVELENVWELGRKSRKQKQQKNIFYFKKSDWTVFMLKI